MDFENLKNFMKGNEKLNQKIPRSSDRVVDRKDQKNLRPKSSQTDGFETCGIFYA